MDGKQFFGMFAKAEIAKDDLSLLSALCLSIVFAPLLPGPLPFLCFLVFLYIVRLRLIPLTLPLKAKIGLVFCSCVLVIPLIYLSVDDWDAPENFGWSMLRFWIGLPTQILTVPLVMGLVTLSIFKQFSANLLYMMFGELVILSPVWYVAWIYVQIMWLHWFHI